MPSIPQSLLWISLVVLWLFVLVPMLINKRDIVRRTSDVALATRVLNRAGGARLIKRGAPAAGHRSDPDWQHAVDEDDLDDEEEFDEEKTGPVVVTSKPSRARTVAVVTSVAEEMEPDYLDVDVVDEDSGALPVGKVDAPVQDAEPELDLEFVSAEPTFEPVQKMVVVEGPVEEPVTDAVPVAEESVEEPVDEDPVDQNVVEDETDLDEFAAERADDGTADEYEYVEDTSGLEAEEDPPTTMTRTGSRSRRYDSKTAEAVSARKYRFRKNMLVAMAVALIGSAGAAFLVSPDLWWACGAIGVVTLLYLGYLRRQTRIEERLRRRRMQRMARARLGVENTIDREFDVVPARLRRPGAAVLEIDDEDPVFEHLDYVPFAREFDLPRAAGQ